MDLKKFLKDHPLISKSDLANAMYPTVPSSAKSKLTNKLNEAKAGTGKQRITPDDLKLVKPVFEKLSKDLSDFAAGID